MTAVDAIKGAAGAVELVGTYDAMAIRVEGRVLVAANAEPGHAVEYTTIRGLALPCQYLGNHIGLEVDQLEQGEGWARRLADTLLPLPQGADRNSVELGKLYLSIARRIAYLFHVHAAACST